MEVLAWRQRQYADLRRGASLAAGPPRVKWCDDGDNMSLNDVVPATKAALLATSGFEDSRLVVVALYDGTTSHTCVVCWTGQTK